VKVGNKLAVDSIFISGEVFRENPKYASWHPFGYALNNCIQSTTELTDETPTNIQLHYLTEQTHKLFVECTQNVSLSNFSKTLRETKEHCVFPPPLLFVGKLSEGIKELDTQMHKLSPKFEGVFVIIEEKTKENLNIQDKFSDFDEMVGYKWKTGAYDEQPVIKMVDDIGFTKEESKEFYRMLVEIYNNKPNKKTKDKKSESNVKTQELAKQSGTNLNDEEKQQLEKTLIKEIVQTFNHEITKQTPLNTIPKAKRESITKTMVEIVKKEIINRYKESDVPNPYPIDLMNKQIPNVVKSLVNKVEYSNK
jgi:hypothetical protein